MRATTFFCSDTFFPSFFPIDLFFCSLSLAIFSRYFC